MMAKVEDNKTQTQPNSVSTCMWVYVSFRLFVCLWLSVCHFLFVSFSTTNNVPTISVHGSTSLTTLKTR